MIRVLYRFEVPQSHQEAFRDAYQEVVAAHLGAGHGAVESALMRCPDTPDELLAMSRWESEAAWRAHQNDAAHPEAYARLRLAGTLIDKKIYEEVTA